MYKYAKVYWTIYNKGSKEIGHSDYLSTFKELENQLLLLCMWQRTRECHINIDVTFYPTSLSVEPVTILGAI